jgi:hypothetical protein
LLAGLTRVGASKLAGYTKMRTGLNNRPVAL